MERSSRPKSLARLDRDASPPSPLEGRRPPRHTLFSPDAYTIDGVTCSPTGEPMPETLIETRNLIKRYGEKVAVNNVSFDVYGGGVFGFLRPEDPKRTRLNS